jgi:toxin ParE1/3/4
MAVRWTQPAADDLSHISDYTEEHFGATKARDAALALWDTADSLLSFPKLGKPGRKQGTRELAVSGLPFLIIYRLRAGVVEILRILHCAQRWP